MTSLSEVGAVCYSDLTVNLAVEVAGGKNLMMSENKMEFDVLAAIIGNKVKERLCFHLSGMVVLKVFLNNQMLSFVIHAEYAGLVSNTG